MKKLLLLFATAVIIFTGCSNESEPEEETNQESAREDVTVSRFTISDDFYNTLFPFEVSAALLSNTSVATNMTGRLDADSFERGLLRLAQEEFPTENYIFQEGQYLNNATISSWLRREAENNPDGLNPTLPDLGSAERNHEAAPLYLAQILEHNYLVEDDNGNYVLGGVVIGLVMNSVHNFNLPDEEGGFPRTVNISEEDSRAQGEEMAGEILQRMRAIEGLEDVPVSFMIYKQETGSSLVPGNFIARADVGSGQSLIGGWSDINESNFLFPSSAAEENVASDSAIFNTFVAKVGEFFPNYIGVIGRGFYVNNQLQRLKIDIPMNFQSRTEVVGFTQYVASLVTQYFPNFIEVNVYIFSTTRQESLIVREADAAEPVVQILR